ncbi:unnamed protein product [Amoebophrya sp. A25]|nr:unnamed protein product [Amoebophrya sp. A25]|eukprot:GSA25T00006280001.1
MGHGQVVEPGGRGKRLLTCLQRSSRHNTTWHRLIERGILGIFRVEGGRGERNQRAVEGDDSSSRSPE